MRKFSQNLLLEPVPAFPGEAREKFSAVGWSDTFVVYGMVGAVANQHLIQLGHCANSAIRNMAYAYRFTGRDMVMSEGRERALLTLKRF
jgi:hypothetical protein